LNKEEYQARFLEYIHYSPPHPRVDEKREKFIQKTRKKLKRTSVLLKTTQETPNRPNFLHPLPKIDRLSTETRRLSTKIDPQVVQLSRIFISKKSNKIHEFNIVFRQKSRSILRI